MPSCPTLAAPISVTYTNITIDEQRAQKSPLESALSRWRHPMIQLSPKSSYYSPRVSRNYQSVQKQCLNTKTGLGIWPCTTSNNHSVSPANVYLANVYFWPGSRLALTLLFGLLPSPCRRHAIVPDLPHHWHPSNPSGPCTKCRGPSHGTISEPGPLVLGGFHKLPSSVTMLPQCIVGFRWWRPS